jgi:hypothetical protein
MPETERSRLIEYNPMLGRLCKIAHNGDIVGAANYRTIPKAIDARIANAKRKIVACTAAVDGVKGSLIECFMGLRGGKSGVQNAPLSSAALS